MGKLVTTIALAVLVLGAALFTVGELIAPEVNDAGVSTAESIRNAF